MRSYRTEAIVLRTHNLGEADRIITLLSKEHGKVRAVAKGVRRTRSKFGARLEPFTRVDLLLHPGKSLEVVTQAVALSTFGESLASDYQRWTAGQSMLEVADQLSSEEGSPVEAQYLLLFAALGALTEAKLDANLVLDSYFLRALSLAGYEPELSGCVTCGEIGELMFFHIPSGGLVCVEHKLPGSVIPKPEGILHLQALLTGNWVVAQSATTQTIREVSGIVAAYLQWHLERALRSLPIVARVAD